MEGSTCSDMKRHTNYTRLHRVPRDHKEAGGTLTLLVSYMTAHLRIPSGSFFFFFKNPTNP